MGRLNYNEVIQQTSKTQTFANIIRVRNHEPTAFVDVTQINAAVLAQANLTGVLTSVGTHPQNSGSGTLGLEYQEAPLITYQPLSGPALVSQISTPLTIDSLTNLFDSDWPIASLLTMGSDRLTPGYEDHYAAINAIIALDNFGAITMSAGVTEPNASNQITPASAPSNPATQGSKPTASGQEPVLIITLHPLHPYTFLLTEAEAQGMIRQLWCRLYTLLNPKTTNCETVPTTIAFSRRALQTGREEASAKNKKAPPITQYPLRTRSALGILKAATEISLPLIAFVSEQEYELIKSYAWNSIYTRSRCGNMSYYTLLPSDKDRSDSPLAAYVYDFLISGRDAYHDPSPEWCLYTISTALNVNDLTSIQREVKLTNFRKYLLVIETDAEIPNSYVSYSDGSKWYSIDSHDEVSQKNFALISQFLTMQALAPSPPPANVISAGPSR
jgi:hypothetical protein